MYSVERTRGVNYLKDFDYFLMFCVAVLTFIGLVALRSATLQATSDLFKKQAIFVAIGFVLCIIISFIDYKDFKPIGTVLYIISLCLLVLVLFKGTGRKEWGSNSWLVFPVIGSFQPSEIAKIAFIIICASYFEKFKEESVKTKDILKLFILASLPVALILKQPDAGTAMVFFFVIIVMLFIFGVSYKYFLGAFGLMAISSPFLWFFVLRDHQKWRIITFIHPELDKTDKGYQVYKAKLAIGSGQLWGQGFGNGLQTQNNGVPIKESDFIFTVIGEEFGFIGTTIVVLFVFMFLIRIIYIASKSRDSFGCFSAIGIGSMFAFHFIENIGMNIGVLPVTGIPLPFISAGGSAMITNFIAVGILLSISMRRNIGFSKARRAAF